MSREVALAAPHPAAVAAGRSVAAAGGNALDAALAAAAMLTVVYPHQCALGGDLIALVRAPGGATTAVIAAGTAPAAIDRVAIGWNAVPRFGAHAVTVPGIVAGWQAIQAQGASRPLGDALAAAADVADAGFPVSAGMRRALESRADAVLADPGMRAVFSEGGAVLAEGATVRQRALAATLRRLAVDPADFYRGETARALVAALRADGGVHTADDFASYAAEVTPALSVRSAGATWTVAPPPSAGAVLLGVIGSSAGDPDPGAVLRASIRGVHARARHLGDPRAGEIDVAAMTDLTADDSAAGREPRPAGDTAAVVAMDDEGWAVTIVQSVYMTFGSGLLDSETGILFHNRGSAFGVDPQLPSMIRPGARPPHTLTPAIAERADTVVIAGCQGGRAQPWILGQLLPDAVSGADLDHLLARPRWAVGDRDLGFDALTFVAEPGVDGALGPIAQDAGLGLASWDGPSDEAGHVQLVRARRAHPLEAASDPRADGLGVVVRQ
ncbi:MAG: gamma-glutamyltransferase [Microbacterium sp.]